MISDEYKAIFIHVPKTAGSSIEKALLNSGAGFRRFNAGDFAPECIPAHAYGYQGLNPWDLKHMPARYLKQKYRDYYRFCFVRNPWDLMVSCYCWWTQKVKLPIRIKQGEILKKLGFEDFVYSFYTDYINEIHHQGLGQSYWVLGFDNRSESVNFVGRYESLQDDFNRICDAVGLPRLALQKVNASKHREYSQYYNDSTTEMVYRKFWIDIQKFRYDNKVMSNGEIIPTPLSAA